MRFDKYLALEFEDRGRGPRYDCWGLVRLILVEEFGIRVPSLAHDYRSAFDGKQIAAVIQAEELRSWELVEAPQAGDVVTLRIAGRPWHCGLMISADRFIHIEPTAGVAIERIDSAMWARRIDGYHRHRSGGDA